MGGAVSSTPGIMKGLDCSPNMLRMLVSIRLVYAGAPRSCNHGLQARGT